MQKHLLVGLNAKYIHSNLAIRSLRDYAASRGIELECQEFTINQRAEQILRALYESQPQVIGFSCYIWNIELIRRLAHELRVLLPDTFLYFGGPEVSFDPAWQLEHSDVDAIVCGEGEEAVYRLARALEKKLPLSDVPNLVYRDHETICSNPPFTELEMKDVPFIYRDEEMDLYRNRILYYESSRGCPFHCQYCLSGSNGAVRMRPLKQVYQHLDFFLKHKVRQVKFVDRTFNCNADYALSIWKYLKEHDNGITNFHFEIAAELLTEEQIAFLQTVRKGAFQFEIGVQSTYEPTLKAIRRFTKLSLLQTITAALHKNRNIHLHLDLIIGLPYEGYERFAQSFNDVYALEPDQLQVGFLKLLKGSGLYEKAKDYGIVCSDYAPYEVLYTEALPHRDLLRLKMIEEMVEQYYNSCRFMQLIRYLVSCFDSPFACFEALADFYRQQEYHLKAHSNLETYDILYRFAQTIPALDDAVFRRAALFDLASHERIHTLPAWLPDVRSRTQKNAIFDFLNDPANRLALLPEYEGLDTKQLIRQVTILFDGDESCEDCLAYLFNYRRCDLLGNAACTRLHYHQGVLSLEESE